MTKLHELLAVDSNLENQATKTTAEVITSFDKKKHLFGEQIVTFTSNEEGAKPVTESQSSIQETVKNQVEFATKILAKAFDVSHQIDVANCLAKADVVTEDGDAILKDVPATSLLTLEKRLTAVRAFAIAIPTIDPALGFVPDKARGKDIFKARDVTKSRTKKVNKPLTLAPATDKHPAQVQLVTEDVVTGTILEQQWSSLITPATKSDIIDRCDVLIRAVKKARAKANETEIDVATLKIGKKVLDYVFKPLA